MSRIASWLRRRIVAPVLQTHAPASQVAWGVGVGMFIALLPVVGQLYGVPALWAACRYLLRRTFHLPIAMAMVILVNPPVKVFLFYGYALTGDLMLRWFGHQGLEGGYMAFRAALTSDGGSWLSNSAHALEIALTRFGPSIVAGGMFWSIVGGPLCFALAWWAVMRNRRRPVGTEPAAATGRASPWLP